MKGLKSFIYNYLLLCLSFCFLQANGAESKTSFNNDWLYHQVKDTLNNNINYFARSSIDKDWEHVSLPHTANIEPLVVNNQWQGICWYRKHFNINSYDNSKKYFLEFEAAMNICEIWINGKFIKKDQGGYLPIVIDISKFLLPDDNVIAIKLDNRDNSVTGPKPLKILDFNMYGGLYRNSWLYEKDNVHITNASYANKVGSGGIFISYPLVSNNKATVKVDTHIVNENNTSINAYIEQDIYFNNKLIKSNCSRKLTLAANGEIKDEQTIALNKPNLWSVDFPNLYRLETKVIVDGKIKDQESTKFGIREFKIANNKLYINGIEQFLTGVNRHQEYPYIGYALSDNAQYRDAYKIKKGGFDYIRLSHYPQSSAFFNACDELGLVVIDGILGWQYYADNDDFRNQCYESARRMIRRDRNHPCVLAWEVSLNETQMPIPFMTELHKIVHEEYPYNYSYSCGWMPDVYDIYLEARQHRMMHKTQNDRTKPYIVSEYGDWEYYSTNAGLNQHSYSKNKRLELSSRQARGDGEKRLQCQAYNLQESHNDNLSVGAIADGYWVMFDYNRGYHPNIETSGVMDIFRLPKFSYDFFKSQKAAKSAEDCVLSIASYWNKTSTNRIKVYSNADEVELLVNGESCGKKRPDTDSISANLPHPPFTFNVSKFNAGNLTAKAYINNKCVKETVVKTAKEPVKFNIKIDVSGKQPQSHCNDVIFVYIEAVDKDNTVCSDYSKMISMQLPEGLTLLNLDGIKAEAGIATALIRVDGNIGDYMISVTDGEGIKGKDILKVQL